MPVPAAVPIIAGAVSFLSNILGGAKASSAMRKQQRNIENSMKENQSWYDRRYNEDYTQRADAQRLLTLTEDSIRKRNRAAAGAAAVMGGNEESVAAAKEANNQALSDAAAKIAAAGEARKDQIEQQYRNRKDALQDQLNNIGTQRAMNTAQAIQGVGNAAASVVGAFGDDIWSKGGYKKYAPGKMPWADASMTSADLARGQQIANGYVDQLMKQQGIG